MRAVREVLRLTFAGVSKREVARRTGMAASTVRATIARFESFGLVWPLPETITDSDLEAKIYKSAGKKQGHRRIIEPDWASLHREMKRKHVTLSILWDEYIAGHPEGYRYSRFCELYRSWEDKISVTMRQAHLGGDMVAIDVLPTRVAASRRRWPHGCPTWRCPWRWAFRSRRGAHKHRSPQVGNASRFSWILIVRSTMSSSRIAVSSPH